MWLPNVNLMQSLSLLLWTLTFLSSHSAAYNALAPQLPSSVPQQSPNNVNYKSWFSRARNSIIQTLWQIPSDSTLSNANGQDSKRPSPPPTLLARYGGDLVLRFEIKSIEEAEALAEAVNILFLDVWEFTPDWADIRLSKDVVGSSCSTSAPLIC